MADKIIPTHKLVTAHARYIRISPQKVRLVADMVRNTPVEQALEQLQFSSKNAALPLAKLINSAIANAVHNFSMTREDLFIKALTVDGGPVLKRFKPRAQGRAGAIHKRTSHISIILEERKRTGKKSSRSFFAGINRNRPEGEHKHDQSVEEGKVDEPKQQNRQAPKTDEKQKQQKISLKRRLFNRKSGQ